MPLTGNENTKMAFKHEKNSNFDFVSRNQESDSASYRVIITQHNKKQIIIVISRI